MNELKCKVCGEFLGTCTKEPDVVLASMKCSEGHRADGSPELDEEETSVE